jgi:xanthine dehydrogenase/oxidase
MDRCTLSNCWYECKQSSDYQERAKSVEVFNSKNRWKKRGIALTATKHHLGFNDKFMMQGAALVMVYNDGSVSLNYAGTELGQGWVTD